jgi:acetyl-CoA/propionyl-CoA carboxylase biotin carboxyl carrier protein
VRAGRLDTGLVGRVAAAADVPADVLAAAAVDLLLDLEPAGPVVDPFDVPGGWRVGGPAWTRWRLTAGGPPVEVRVRGRAADVEVVVGDGPPVRATGRRDGDRLVVTLDGVTRTYAVARDGHTVHLGRDGRAWAVREQAPVEAERSVAPADGEVRSPMPGTVTLVEAEPGRRLAAGDRLLVVEAMKTEHVLTAPVAGVLRELRARPGATVRRDEVLAVVEPEVAGGS